MRVVTQRVVLEQLVNVTLQGAGPALAFFLCINWLFLGFSRIL